MVNLFLSIVFTFPPLIWTFQPTLDGVTSWKLYTWNAKFSYYCERPEECQEELEAFPNVTVTILPTRQLELTLPAGVKPGQRNLILVPVYGTAPNDWEGLGPTMVVVTVPQPQ